MKKMVFTVSDVSRTLGITNASARVLCARSVSHGRLTRLRKGLYIFTEHWQTSTQIEKFQIANRIQPASYISLGSALAWYGGSSQVYQSAVESVARKRSIIYPVGGWEFRYHRITDALYSGYYRYEGVFIARPGKALADVIYLQSLGRYAFDFSALVWEAVNDEEFGRYLDLLPQKTRLWWDRYEPTAGA